MLGQSNSQQASACRSFDRQQQQALRKPPEDTTAKQLASLEKDLRRSPRRGARSPRKWSSAGPSQPTAGQHGRSVLMRRVSQILDVRQDFSPGGAPIPWQSKSRRSRRRSAPRPGTKDRSLTDRARRRLGDATEAVRKSADEIREGHRPEAASQARAAADQLERLRRQVGP